MIYTDMTKKALQICFDTHKDQKDKRQSGRQFLINHPEFTDERYDNSLWAPSYFVASAGEVPAETIKAYIEGQYD